MTMGNNSKTLFLVAEGEATEAEIGAEFDGVDSVLVLARNADDALRLADRFDRDEIAPDNVVYHGRTIVAVVEA